MINKLLRVSLLLLIPVILSSCSVSKRITNYQSAPPDSLLLADKINLTEYEQKYAEYDGVYLFVKNTMEHSGADIKLTPIASGWEYHKIKKVRYVVLNPDNEELTTYSVTMHPKVQVNNFYLLSVSPSGEIKKYKLSDLFIEKDADGYSDYKFSFPGIVKGSIIEEGIDLTYNARDVSLPIEYGVELQYSLPCEKIEFSFAYPDWWQINSKRISPTSKIDYITEHNEDENKTTIKYKADNVPAITKEPFSPFFLEVAKYLDLQITNLQAGVQYSNPKDWKEYASRLRSYLDRKDVIYSSLVSLKAKQLTRDYTTSMEKLQSVIDFIQQEIEIAKDSEDRNFSEVIEDRRGDPYEICGLTQAMLNECEIETDFLLIHSAADGYFDEDYISSSELGIPAVNADIDGKNFVIIPYFKNLPINHIPENIQNQKALVVSNDDSRNGTLRTVPEGNMAGNNFTEIYNLELNDNGIISVKEEKVIEGSFAYDIRNYLTDLKEDELKEYIESLLTYTEGNVEVDTFRIENQDNYKEPLILKLEYSINNLLTVTPEEIIFQTGGLLTPSSLIRIKVEEKERVNPIKINYDMTFQKKINLSYPPQWKLTTVLKDSVVENEFGYVKGEYKISESSLSIMEVSKLHKCTRPKEKITELLEITGKSSKFNIPAIIFSKEDTALK